MIMIRTNAECPIENEATLQNYYPELPPFVKYPNTIFI
jgi:hypothetical protein